MRKLIINSKNFTWLTANEIMVVFDPAEFTDSQALHRFLTQYAPGEDYTVSFSNIPSNYARNIPSL